MLLIIIYYLVSLLSKLEIFFYIYIYIPKKIKIAFTINLENVENTIIFEYSNTYLKYYFSYIFQYVFLILLKTKFGQTTDKDDVIMFLSDETKICVFNI